MVSDIAVTQIISFASLVFTGVLGYFMFRAKSASELAVIQANAAAAQAAAAAAKVETVAVTAGIAANRALSVASKVDDVKRTLDEGSERRDAQLDRVVAKVEAVQVAVEKKADNGPINIKLDAIVKVQDATAVEVAEVKKTAIETHVLVDGQMGAVLEIGLEAAQGRHDDNPTAENKAKLEAARKKFDEHNDRMKIVEAKNAVTPDAQPEDRKQAIADRAEEKLAGPDKGDAGVIEAKP